MQIVLFCLAVFAIVILIAYLVKGLLAMKPPESIAEKYANSDDSKNIFVKKYKEADVGHYKGIFTRIGLLVVMGMLLLAFNYSKKERNLMDLGVIDDIEEIEVEPPQTQQKQQPPPPPPPPPPPEIEIVEDDEILEEEPEIQEVEVDVEEVVEVVEVEVDETGDEEVYEPEPEPEEPEIFTIVEQMPEYPGGQAALYKYIGKKLNYPAIARENGIEGLVVVQFVVNENGSLSDVKVLKDIGGGCGDEAARVIRGMPNWKPGMQRGKPVKVQFNCPVRFKLD